MDRTLVERVREVEELYALVGDTAKGEGAVALIEGKAGVGKSTLLAQARARAERDGARVLTARGSELESLFSFGVVRQLFEGVLTDKKGRAGALKGAAAAAEAAFGPPGDQGEPGGDESFTTLHGLYWLALNLAEKQPLVLAVDDLHWCDRASLSFIAYLAGRLEGQPILVATTLRSTDPGVDPALVADIVHAPTTRAVRPGPLSAEAVAELVRERLGPNAEPEFCSACHSATGGNPLLLGQLLTALEGDSVKPDAQSAGAVRDIGPRAVSRGVLLRLARLPGPAVEVARAVAVMGDGADLATITAFTGLDETTVAATSGDLARAEILAPETPLSFVHPLVRDAVYEELSPAERELQHARAVEVMVAAGAGDEHVAAHLLLMAKRGDQWVVDRLVEAARAAIAQGAAESAVAYLRRAFDEPAPTEQRPQLLLELGTAEALASGAEAVEHLQAAYEQLEDPAQRIAAAPVLAESLIFRGRAGEAAAFAREAARHVPEEMAAMREVLEGIELGTTMFGVAEPDMVGRLGEYRDRPVGPGPGDKMLAAMTAWEWALTGGGADECVELARQALTDDSVVVAENGFLTVPAITVMAMADLDEAAERWDRLVAQTQASGSHFAVLVRAPVERHHPDPPRRAGRGRGAAAHRPGRAVHVGSAAPSTGPTSPAPSPWCCWSGATWRGRGASWASARPASTTTTTPATSGCAARPRSCWPRAGTRRRSSALRSSARWSAGWSTPPGCPGARSRPSRWTGSAAPTRRSPGRRRNWSTRAAGARRARSAAACGCWAPCAARKGWTCWTRRWPCWSPRRPSSSWPRRWPHRARRCGASASPPTRASRCGGRWSWPSCATPAGWPPRCAPSCTPPAAGRGPTP